MKQWLTPDNLPVLRTVERAFFLPNDPAIMALVSGALSELANPDNWEAHGAKTPDETAEYFMVILSEYYG